MQFCCPHGLPLPHGYVAVYGWFHTLRWFCRLVVIPFACVTVTIHTPRVHTVTGYWTTHLVLTTTPFTRFFVLTVTVPFTGSFTGYGCRSTRFVYQFHTRRCRTPARYHTPYTVTVLPFVTTACGYILHYYVPALTTFLVRFPLRVTCLPTPTAHLRSTAPRCRLHFASDVCVAQLYTLHHRLRSLHVLRFFGFLLHLCRSVLTGCLVTMVPVAYIHSYIPFTYVRTLYRLRTYHAFTTLDYYGLFIYVHLYVYWLPYIHTAVQHRHALPHGLHVFPLRSRLPTHFARFTATRAPLRFGLQLVYVLRYLLCRLDSHTGSPRFYRVLPHVRLTRCVRIHLPVGFGYRYITSLYTVRFILRSAGCYRYGCLYTVTTHGLPTTLPLPLLRLRWFPLRRFTFTFDFGCSAGYTHMVTTYCRLLRSLLPVLPAVPFTCGSGYLRLPHLRSRFCTHALPHVTPLPFTGCVWFTPAAHARVRGCGYMRSTRTRCALWLPVTHVGSYATCTHHGLRTYTPAVTFVPHFAVMPVPGLVLRLPFGCTPLPHVCHCRCRSAFAVLRFLCPVGLRTHLLRFTCRLVATVYTYG